jgi:hypothetical protein
MAEMTVRTKFVSVRFNGRGYLRYFGANWIIIRTERGYESCLDNVEVHMRDNFNAVVELHIPRGVTTFFVGCVILGFQEIRVF